MKRYAERADGQILTFEHSKPFIVADRLDDLTGPTNGVITLPIAIDWTPANTFDLANPVRVRSMYTKVLSEAADERTLATYINKAVLLREWRLLRLPVHIKRGWEAAYPELAAC